MGLPHSSQILGILSLYLIKHWLERVCFGGMFNLGGLNSLVVQGFLGGVRRCMGGRGLGVLGRSWKIVWEWRNEHANNVCISMGVPQPSANSYLI